MKTILKSSLLSILFLIAGYGDLFADTFFYGYTEEGVILSYRYNSFSNNCECEVALCHDNNYSGVVTIPSEVVFESKTLTVKGIGETAFRNCKGITTIIIPSTVSYIRNSAFKGCSNLTFVNIPDGLTSIGESAFQGCSNLLSIYLPECLTLIDSYTFSGCSSISSIDLPEGLTSIGSEAFSGCSDLLSIDLPEGLTSIGSCAFQGCIKLKEVFISQNIESVGYQAFMACDSLRKVGINCNAIVSKQYNSYGYNTGLSEIFGSQVIQYILGNSIHGIGQYAFSNCTDLSSINIPNSVSYIGSGAFRNCNNLMEVSINSDVIVSKDKKNNSGDIFSKIFGSQVRQYILGDSIKGVGSYTFYNSTNMVSIEISKGLNKIGCFAFANCSQLTSLELPPTLESIGANAFENCSNLKTINIPENIVSLESCTFKDCSSLETLIFPNKITDIGSYAFSGCSSLENINLSESITAIGTYAFEGCKKIKEVLIYHGVRSIGNQAFMGCDSLTRVSINSNYIVGSSYTNSSESGLSYIFGPQVQQYVFGDSIRQIGAYAFYGCHDLCTLFIPQNVNQISCTSFLYCKNLTSILVDTDNPIFDSRNNCNAIMRTNQNSLVLTCQNTILPDETEILESYSFSTIQQGASVSLPDNINYINSNAFIVANETPNIPYILVNKGTKTLLTIWKYGYVSGRNAPYQIGKSISYENQLLPPVINVDSTTQTKACCRIENYYEDYTYSQDSVFDISGLWPEIEYPQKRFYVGISKDDVCYYIYTPKFTTKSLVLGIECDGMLPTSLLLYGTHDEGDAILSDQNIEVNGIVVDGDSCQLKGLEPSTNYSCKYSVQVLNSNNDETRLYSVSKKVKTGDLVFTTFAPKVVSEGNVIVSAQTNLNDDEEVGFAWRRTDWTSDFESKKATAYLYEGMMEGIIYNVSSI